MKKGTVLIGTDSVGRFLALLVAGVLWVAGMAGCLGGGKSAGGGAAAGSSATDAPDAPVKPALRYKVVVDQTDFFRISPQQPAGPDDHLKKDTRVTFLKRYGGYTQVRTAGGIPGYVPSEDVAQISAQEVAQEDAALLARQAPPAALAPITSGPGGTYSIPPEATRDTVLPVQDTAPTDGAAAKPTPNPMFRY